MKIAIIYDTKTGTTAQCAKLLSEKLEDADLFYLAEEAPVLSIYDKIVIGGYVRYGGINISSRDFIMEHEDLLEKKDVSLFLCCVEKEKVSQMVHRFYSKRVMKNVTNIACFGASLPLDKLKGFAKIAARSMLKKLPAPPCIDREAIERFAEELKK